MNDNEWNDKLKKLKEHLEGHCTSNYERFIDHTFDAMDDLKDLERTISSKLMLICLFAGSALAFSIAAFVLVLIQ